MLWEAACPVIFGAMPATKEIKPTEVRSNSASVWRDYRRYRRNLLALFELERRLAADLYEAGERAGDGAPSALEVAFLAEACRALQDAAEEARAGLRGILSALDPDLRSDSEALLEAAKRRVPDLDHATQKAAVEHLVRHGGPEGLLATLDEHLGARVRRYRSGARALQKTGSGPGTGLDAAKEAVFPPRLQGADSSVGAEAGRELARAFTDATSRAERAIRAGATYPAALAEREVVAARLVAHDAVVAVRLGISPGPGVEPEPLLCLIAGFGWAVCVVVLLIAVSSHNVDEDEEDGDTTGG